MSTTPTPSAGTKKLEPVDTLIYDKTGEIPIDNDYAKVCEILLEDGFPIFIKMGRVSGEKVIQMYKFRSMVKNAPELKSSLLALNERKDGPFFKMTNDPRVTKVGKFIRKFRLDEFPQSINVLKGEMSIVGPRPYFPQEIAQYPPQFKSLSEAKGGVTGLSQVMGASKLSFQKTLELDAFYESHQSLWLDMKILWKTIIVFFSDPTGV